MVDEDPPPVPDLRLDRIERRLASNEAESIALRGAVQELTGALTVLNEVRRQQEDTAQRVEDAADLAEQTQVESIIRTNRLWRTLIGLAAGVVLLTLVVNVLMFSGLTNYIVDLLNQQRSDRIAGCEVRNEATRVTIRREEDLAMADPDPKVVAIHREAAAGLRKGIVDCQRVTRVTR